MISKILVGFGIITLLLLTGANAIYFYNTMVVESKEASASAPATTSYLPISSATIAYQEVNNGSDTTVLFIGGLSAWHGTWARAIQAIDKNKLHFNYIAIDLPPFGYSQVAPDASYFRDNQAHRIAQFVDKKQLKQVILVGHSYGAGPITEFALTHTEKVAKLIIIDGVLNIDESKAKKSIPLINFNYLRNLLIGILIHNDSFALSQFKSFVYLKDSVDAPLIELYTRPFNTQATTLKLSYWLRDYLNDPLNYKSNSSANYKTIPFPVRLIWGNKDTLTPIKDTKVLLSTIPNVKLHTLDEVGHIPMIENPEKFDAALLASLTQ